MVKLTAELIEQSAQYTNPVRDRELDLRGKVVNFIHEMKTKIFSSRVLCLQPQVSECLLVIR